MNNKIVLLMSCALLVCALFFTGCSIDTTEVYEQTLMDPYISVQPVSRAFKQSEVPSSMDDIKLSVVVWDWDGFYGSLSYQWYRFTNIDDYLSNDGAGTAIQGATSDSYTLPASLDTSEGKKYYYYVEVKNSNSAAIDKTEETIRSEVAIISFLANTAAEQPIITRHPASNEYIFGSSMAPLGVKTRRATNVGSAFSYQWYTSDAENFADIDMANGTPVRLALSDSLMADLTTMKLGGNFYWVVVRNQPSGEYGSPTQEMSIPAKITLKKAPRAVAPRITQQPRDKLYFVGDTTLSPVELDAVSPDLGTLTYQWYSNTEPRNSGGTVVTATGGITITDGGKKLNYSASNAATAGLTYYYVEITNTNENVEDPTVEANKTAKITSKVVQVRVHAKGNTSTGPTTTITIDDPTNLDNRYNYVRGYGGMNVAWTNFPEEKLEDTRTMYGNGPDQFGYNIMRIMIMPWNTNVDIMMNDLMATRPDYYESVKFVNENGGYVLASPWSPPKEWKTNNSINGGGRLIKSYYRQFGNYLKSFARHMYDKGAPIYAISIANEPNYTAGYDGCEWNGEQMRDFFKEVGRFTNGVKGWGGGREIPTVLTVNGESANNPDINFPALADPISRASIDFYARHVYGEQTETLWKSPYADYKEGSGYRTECWMTEHNINSANAVAYKNDSTWDYVWRFMNDIDLVMRINNENAFVWWASKRFYSMLGDGQEAGKTTDGQRLPRGWGLSHYAKYTIDSTRISITVENGSINGDSTAVTQGGSPKEKERTGVINSDNFHLDNLSAKITAYVSADGNEITMVMWTPTNPDGKNGTNMGRIQINMPLGFTIGSASAARSTSASSVMVPEPVDVNELRTVAYVSLPASNILSLRFTR